MISSRCPCVDWDVTDERIREDLFCKKNIPYFADGLRVQPAPFHKGHGGALRHGVIGAWLLSHTAVGASRDMQ
jgi:hypothetical protein